MSGQLRWRFPTDMFQQYEAPRVSLGLRWTCSVRITSPPKPPGRARMTSIRALMHWVWV